MPLYDQLPSRCLKTPPYVVVGQAARGHIRRAWLVTQKSGVDSASKNSAAVVSNAAKKDLRSEGGSTEIELSGPIEKISVPSTWARSGQASTGAGYHITFTSPGQYGGAIMFDSYGKPLGQAASTLLDLCRGQAKIIYSSDRQGAQANSDAQETRAAHVVKQLTGVLEQGRDGNNQFTSPKNPLFHIDKLEVKPINGKFVLSMNGYFNGKGGAPPQLYLSVVHVPQPVGGGVVVHTLRYQSVKQEEFLANRGIFEKSLSSIRWQRWYRQ